MNYGKAVFVVFLAFAFFFQCVVTKEKSVQNKTAVEEEAHAEEESRMGPSEEEEAPSGGAVIMTESDLPGFRKTIFSRLNQMVLTEDQKTKIIDLYNTYNKDGGKLNEADEKEFKKKMKKEILTDEQRTKWSQSAKNK